MPRKHVIAEDAELDAASRREVARDFKARLASEYQLKIAGSANKRAAGYLPKRYPAQLRLTAFGVNYWLSAIRRDNGFRFFVAYVLLPGSGKSGRVIYPRIFYKDSSLIWRSATHYIRSEHEHWVGKGELKPVIENGREVWYTAEETTDLPFEIQGALEAASRRFDTVPEDTQALGLVLRNAPDDRVYPYQDFSAPRERARRDPELLINNGKSVAWFEDDTNPASLKFKSGFQPDFENATVSAAYSRSRLFGGAIVKYRILSANQRIQYMFIVAPSHVWIVPPQALNSDIMSYGVRTIDVEVDEKLCIPGFEYHYLDESVDPPQMHSQIPTGFAGSPNSIDPGRADASPWNEKMPIIQEFRKFLSKSSWKT